MKKRTIKFRAKDVDGVKWLHGDLRYLLALDERRRNKRAVGCRKSPFLISPN